MTSKSKFFSVATTTRTYVSVFFLTLGDRLFSGFAGLLKPPAQSGCRMPDAGCRMPDAGCRAIPAAVSRDRMFSMNAGEKPAHI
jgi:hypothetical protein